LRTYIGEGLFDFGLVDGPAASARLQHPLGVAVLGDGSIAIADTYNGAIRRFDPVTSQVSTLVMGLDEPSGLVVSGDALLVVESGAHRIVAVEPAVVSTDATPMAVVRPVTDLAPGPVTLDVVFTPPAGRKLDESEGPATRISVSGSPPSVLLDGAGSHTTVPVQLLLAEGAGVLNVTAQAASCDDDGSEHPACYLSRQDWGIPIRVAAGGAQRLELMLLG
jgi:NHL repeat